MDEWLPLVAYGLNRISLETNARCGRCNKEAKRKSFLKGDIGYRKSLINELSKPPYLTNHFDLYSLIQSYGVPKDNPCLCQTCYERVRAQLLKKANQVQLDYNEIETFPNTYHKNFKIDSTKEPYHFRVSTSPKNKWVEIAHLRFYAKWYGYNKIINIAYDSSGDGLIISGSMVKVIPDSKRSAKIATDLNEKKLEQLERLGRLRSSGVLTEEEFEAQKKKIIK
ncbi:SHOCT domain-containing protein [Turicibacter sanguinis]|uniref:SHOCT domain-containing protein n=1 Tax=Turicibacter sanguinis TaxID=154288 RepID=UPI00189E9522|nr:SHOCT domain-containing protein [Turicibacter sanguinis]